MPPMCGRWWCTRAPTRAWYGARASSWWSTGRFPRPRSCTRTSRTRCPLRDGIRRASGCLSVQVPGRGGNSVQANRLPGEGPLSVMELVTVGTGTVAPSATRTAACHWVSRGALKILLDCGAGALHRLVEFGLPWHDITHVVLSHFHPDHWGELPMLVYALKYTTLPARHEPLVILGPPGVVRLVKALAPGYGP